jgi:hypothetical protein
MMWLTPHHPFFCASWFAGGFFIEGEAGPCSSLRTGRADKVFRRSVDDEVCDDVWDEVWELDVCPKRF